MPLTLLPSSNMPVNQLVRDYVERDGDIGRRNEGALQCARCEETFTDPFYLDQHVLSEHTTTVKASVPVVSSKLQTSTDHMYPPKKRAMYDYKRRNSIEKHVSDGDENQHVAKPHGNLSQFQIKDKSKSEQSRRPRHSSTVSLYSRDPSSYTIPVMRDHHTPERNSMVDRLGPNSDISKPLFPSSDSETSLETEEEENPCMEDNSGRISRTSSFQKASIPGAMVDRHCHGKSSYSFQNSIPKSVGLHPIHEISAQSECGNIAQIASTYSTNIAIGDTDASKAEVSDNEVKNETRQSVITHNDRSIDMSKAAISNTEHANNKTAMSHTGQAVNRTSSMVHSRPATNFMGPMVSLLDRFNDTDVPAAGLDQRNTTHLDEKSFLYTQTNPSSHYTQRHVNGLEGINMIKNEVSEIYNCSLCDKEFRQSGNFHNHMKTHSSMACRCKCGLCGLEFTTSDGLQGHMRSHHTGSDPYKCQHCDRQFSQYNNLRRHMRMHREKIFKCKLCDREFNEEFYLTMHMGTHTGQRLYSCGVCNAGFQSSHDLKAHVKTHSPSQLHVCPVCGKGFSKACVLRQHKKAHSGERPHKCTQCTKTFIHRHHLTMHLRSHTSAKPYTCEYCNKEFTQSSHLYKHVRQHAQDDAKENIPEVARQQSMSATRSIPDVKENNNYTNHTVQNIPGITLGVRNHNLLNSEGQLAQNVTQDIKQVSQPKRRRLSKAESTENPPGLVIESNSKYIPVQPVPNVYPNLLQPFLPPVTPFSHVPPHLAMMFATHPPVASVPSYEQMCQQYTTQFHTYYNSYLMNYMSQAAILGQGHLAQLQGQPRHGTAIPQLQQHNSEVISSNTKNVDLPNVSMSTRQTVRNYETMEQPSRTEIAHELLKMSTPVHHNTTEIQKALEGQVIERSESHVVQKSNNINNQHLNVDSTDKAVAVSGSNISNQALYKAKDFCISGVHSKCDSPALNLSLDTRNKQTSEFCKDLANKNKPNDNTKDNEIPMRYVQYVSNNRDLVSSVVSSHPVIVPLPPSLATDKDGHFQTNNLTSRQQNTRHIVVSSRSSQNENQYLGMSKENTPVVSGEITHSNHSPDDVAQDREIVITNTSGPIQTHSTNSLLCFSQAFSVPKSSYKPDNLKTGTKYSSLPGFRTVHPSKSDTLDVQMQQNYSADTLPLVNSPVTSDSIVACSNSCFPIEDNKLPPMNETVNHTDIGANDIFSGKPKDYLAAPANQLSHVNDSETDNGKEMVDVDNVSDIDETDNERSCNGDRSFELPLTESDDIKDLRRRITEIKDIIEAGTVDDGGENEYTEMEGMDGTEMGNCSFKHLDSESESDTSTDGAAIEGGYMELEQMDKPAPNTIGLSVNSTELSVNCSEMDTNSWEEEEGECPSDLENKRLEISVDESLNGVKVSFNIETIDSLSGDAISTVSHVIERNMCEHTGVEIATDMENIDHTAGSMDITDIAIRKSYMDVDSTSHSESIGLDLRNRRHSGSESSVDMRTDKDDGNESESRTISSTGHSESIGLDLRNCQQSGNESSVDMRMDKGTGNNNESDSRITGIKTSAASVHVSASQSPIVTESVKQPDMMANTHKNSDDNTSENPNHKLTCYRCWKVFGTEDELVSHQSEHAQECNIQSECEFCQRKFNRPFDLQCHILMKHRDHLAGNSKPVNNPHDAGKVHLNTVSSREKAVSMNLGFRCKYCDKMFGDEQTYVAHVHSHLVKKPYICTICSRDFAQKHNLKRHMMTHNAKNHECDTCGRSFKEKYYLQMHQKIHIGEKMRGCEICGRDVVKSEFWGHMKTHLGGILGNPTYDQIGERVKELVWEKKNGSTTSEQRTRNILGAGTGNLLNCVTSKTQNRNETLSIGEEKIGSRDRDRNENWAVRDNNHDADNGNKCPVCHRDFNHKSDFFKHYRIHEMEAKFKYSEHFENSSECEQHHGKENVQIIPNMKLRTKISTSQTSGENIPLNFKLNFENVSPQSNVVKEKMFVVQSNDELNNVDWVDSVPDSTTD